MPPPPAWIRTLSADSFRRKIEQAPEPERSHLLWLRYAADPAFFAEELLPGHCRLPFAAMHRTLFEWHGEMGRGRLPRRRGKRFVLAAPRGSAKSTVVSFLLALHDIVFARERYILLLSSTEKQAQQRLRALRRELERPDVARWCLAARGPVRFTARTLAFGGVQVDAYGAGCEIRGIGAGGYRPTKIILDDAEASRAASSARARERLRDWFAEIVEYLGDSYTHILAIGTVLHEQGLLASLMRRPDFTALRARAVERFPETTPQWEQWRAQLLDLADPHRRETAREFFLQHRAAMEAGTEVLWPEKEDIEELMAQLTLQGRRAFFQEKQNTPLGPEDALFDAESALRAQWRGETLLVGALRAGSFATIREYPHAAATARRFAYLDSALGKGRHAGSGDFAALATVLLLPDGSLVADRLTARRLPPTEQVARLFAEHDRQPIERAAIEGTGFQELLLLPIEAERSRRRRAGQRADLPIEAHHPRQSKAARIASLEPLLAGGLLALGADLDEEFWEELGTWPRSRHDDALDALAGAVALARSAHGAGGGSSITSTQRSRAHGHF